jgi:hypothetical protein
VKEDCLLLLITQYLSVSFVYGAAPQAYIILLIPRVSWIQNRSQKKKDVSPAMRESRLLMTTCSPFCWAFLKSSMEKARAMNVLFAMKAIPPPAKRKKPTVPLYQTHRACGYSMKERGVQNATTAKGA